MRLVATDPYCLSAPPYGIIGPSVVTCLNANAPDAGSLIMICTHINGPDSGVCTPVYRSFDGGKSWRREADMERSYVFDHRFSAVKVGDGSLFYDETAGVLLYVGNDATWIENKFDSTKRCYLPYYRLSYDNGHTWTPKRRIILDAEDGARYTPDKPIRGVEYGRNMCLCCQSGITRAGDGGLLVGIQIQLVDASGDLLEPCGFHFFSSSALKAVWNAREEAYHWTIGENMAVTPCESTRGVFEPQFAALNGHGVLAIMRMSNQNAKASIAGGKYMAVSHDCAATWSRLEKLKYDDGRELYSSSSIVKLLNHSNGRIYLICALSPDAGEPDGNWPRHRLCAMEIDRKSFAVKADTVLNLTYALLSDAEDSGAYDFTNHGVYEDPASRNIIVLAPYKPKRSGPYLARFEISP